MKQNSIEKFWRNSLEQNNPKRGIYYNKFFGKFVQKRKIKHEILNKSEFQISE